VLQYPSLPPSLAPQTTKGWQHFPIVALFALPPILATGVCVLPVQAPQVKEGAPVPLVAALASPSSDERMATSSRYCSFCFASTTSYWCLCVTSAGTAGKGGCSSSPRCRPTVASPSSVEMMATFSRYCSFCCDSTTCCWCLCVTSAGAETYEVCSSSSRCYLT